MKLIPVRSWSLASQMTIWYAVSSFALVLIATGILYHALYSGLAHEDDVFLAQNAQTLKLLLDKPKDEMDEFRQELILEQSSGRPVWVWLRILDGAGGLVVETPDMSRFLPRQMFPPPSEETQEVWKGETVWDGQETYRVVTVSAEWPAHVPPLALLQVAVDMGQNQIVLTKYRKRLLIVLGLSLLACAWGGYWIAHRGIRLVKEMAQTAAKIRSTTLDERLETSGLPSELSDLAVTFNGMLDRLEESFSRLSRFSADIAHELRVPIHNLRVGTEVILRKARTMEEYQEVLGSGMEEYQRLSLLIDRLLFLARAESETVQIQLEKVDLSRELNLLREYYELSVGEAGIRFDVEMPPNLELPVDRALFQRAVGNLIENSIKHTPAGGTIKMEVTPEVRKVKIAISDTGKGIPESQLPHVFDRFYRGDASRSSSSGGAGLGLSIVQSIMVLHGGSVDIQSQPAKGTTVTLLFPSRKDDENVILSSFPRQP